MSYLGNDPAEAYSPTVKDTFSGNGSTTDFTLSLSATTNGVEVFVENVQQEPTTAYTISGTTLSFTAAPTSGTNNIYVIHRGPAVQQVVPPAGVAIDASTVTASSTISATGNISTEGDLKVEVSSGGIYTITGTDTSSNRTLTLPDEAGTVLTSASSLSADNITGHRYFYAYKSGTTAQSVTPSTDTKVELDGAIQSGTSWSTTNDEFTATADDAGVWLFTGQVSFFADGNNMDNPRAYIFFDTGSGYTKGAGGYSWIWDGTDDVRHFVTQVQQVLTLSATNKVALYGAMEGTTTSFFAGDSTAGYKQCSLVGVKLS